LKQQKKEKKNTLKTLLWKLKFVRASLQHRRLSSPQSVRYTVVRSGEKWFPFLQFQAIREELWYGVMCLILKRKLLKAVTKIFSLST
jgi:polC_Gram_pos: DNA polymerase III, alpha subunit, Gram-positive type